MPKTPREPHQETDRKAAFDEAGQPSPPHSVEAEQAREADEQRRARGAEASKSVRSKHTGGR